MVELTYHYRCAANPRHKRRQGFATYMGERPCPHMCGHAYHKPEVMDQVVMEPTYAEDVNMGIR